MAGGGAGGTPWIKLLAAGVVCLGVAHGLGHFLRAETPGWIVGALLAMGGMAVVFASCEAMVLSVDGAGRRAGLNPFVAGTMAGLASNVPELVMLGFVLAAEPRVGLIVVVFTLHVGALAFGMYSALLPRDASGHARMPEPLVRLSTDLYACAAGVFLAMGLLMLAMRLFLGGDGSAWSFSAADLYVVGSVLLGVEVVAVWQLVVRFSGPRRVPADAAGDEAGERREAAESPPAVDTGEPLPSVERIAILAVVGIVASVVGGHAVGEFADMLVGSLQAAGYSEMVGALVLALFACAGAYAMAASAHRKQMYDVALASVSGQITQVPFVVMPIALILIAAFAQSGITPALRGGGVLPIDLETTSVVLLSFPSLLILWKAVQDDGAVNWIETATMTAIFGLTIYFLAVHG